MNFEKLLAKNIAKLDMCDSLLNDFKIENAKTIDDAMSQVGNFVTPYLIKEKPELISFYERYEALKLRNKARPTEAEMNAKQVLKTILYLIKRVPNVKKVENYPRLKDKIDAVKLKMNAVLCCKEWIPDALQLELNNKLLELETAYQLKAREQAIIKQIENARIRTHNGILALKEGKTNLVDAYEELLNAYTDSGVLLSQISLFADDKEKTLFEPHMTELEKVRKLVNKPLQDANRTFVNLIIKELEAAVHKKDIQRIKSIKQRTLEVPHFATSKTADAQKKAFSKAYEACDEMETRITEANNQHIEYHCKNHENKQQSNTALSMPADERRETKLFYERTKYEALIKSDILPALNELDKQRGILIKRRDSNKRKVEFDSAINILNTLIIDLHNKIDEYRQTKISTTTFESEFQQILTKVDRDVLSSPRGDWSVTRVLDRLAEAIDAIIDFMSGQQQTSKLAFSFFHHKTTTETIYEKLVDVVDTRMRP